MKRKIYQRLLDWKKQQLGRTALLIEGARRIGKSYVVEAFARQEYDDYLLVDFSAAQPEVHELFTHYAGNIDTLLSRLQLYYDKPLPVRPNPDAEAPAVIIFDEIQFCSKARAAIKHLVADRRFDYLETGSLVSIKKNVKDILLPSEEISVEMFPMDFEEFLWSQGNEILMPFIAEQFRSHQPLGGLHRKAMDLFRQYLIVGGMPQAVDTFTRSGDFVKTDKQKRVILGLYRNDISHYADRQENNVTQIFDALPGQLQKHDKIFRLSSLKEEARMRDYADAFFWLSDARVINCCFNTTAPNIGLRLNENRSAVKCYMADTGLLISHAFSERAIENDSLYKKLMFNTLSFNSGMLMENMVSQMLRASGHQLFFYAEPSREADNRMEIDFLVAKPTVTSRHNISPIEVKSGKNYTLSSLRKCLTKYADHMATPYVLHEQDLKSEDGILYLPLYMTPLL